MKKIIMALLLSMTMMHAGFFQEPDKQLHMKASAFFGVLGAVTCKGENGFALEGWKAVMCGTAVGMIPGFVKEGLDSQQEGNRWDNRDIDANFIGAFIGSIGTVTIWEFQSGNW